MIEDFTDPSWIEVDPNSHINIASSTHIDFDCYRNENAYFYKDKGENYFTTFKHNIDVKITETPHLNDMFVFYGLTNLIGDLRDVFEQYEPAIIVMFDKVSSGQRMVLYVWDDTYYTASVWTGWVQNKWYYFTIGRNATDTYCKIYNDANRTDLITTLSVSRSTRDAGNLRYIYAASSYNSGHGLSLEGDIENLDLAPVTPKKLILRLGTFEGIALGPISKKEKVMII